MICIYRYNKSGRGRPHPVLLWVLLPRFICFILLYMNTKISSNIYLLSDGYLFFPFCLIHYKGI
jgi:Na+/melibiose symporter-like transporter